MSCSSTEAKPSYGPERERFVEECNLALLPSNERPVPAPLCFGMYDKEYLSPDRAGGDSEGSTGVSFIRTLSLSARAQFNMH